MAARNPKLIAGPPGRARFSPVLMQRKGLQDPRIRMNAALLATSRRTARGVPLLDLGIDTPTPPQVQEQMRLIQACVNSIITELQRRNLMELA